MTAVETIELWANKPLLTLAGKNISFSSLVIAIAFLIGIWWFASLLERSVHRIARGYADEPWKSARIHMLSRLLRYAVWVIGTFVGLNYAGIDLSGIALLGSALAVGLGFGLQNIVSNFVSGLVILLERSLKVGDFVDLASGLRGHVKEIAMRYTRITTNDSLDVLVPNSEFITGRVVNWTFNDSHRRMHIPFGVAYGTAKELVREAGIEAASKIEGIVDSGSMKSNVWLVNYGDSSVNYELVVWADRRLTTHPASTHAKLMWALDDALAARNIEIPFPQRDLNIRTGTLNMRMVDGEATDAKSDSATPANKPTQPT
ncbi:MAG: mechanosensitive ion channel domain-containing protein [Casimicrobium sp.]